MAYVIAEPCIGTKDTACVDACPVDCIHPKKNTNYEDGRPGFDQVEKLYIDPVECIDCGACVPVCPVTAIFPLDDLPEKWRHYAEIDARDHNGQMIVLARKLRRKSPERGRLSLRAISAELAKSGFISQAGKPYAATAIARMLGEL